MSERRFSELVRSFETDSELLKSSGGLRIYQNAYRRTLAGQLASTFPGTAKLLDQNFNFFALQYMNQFPSTAPDLNDYGEDFPVLLASRQELEDTPYISHLADLEWFYFNAKPGQQYEAVTGIFELWAKLNAGEALEGLTFQEQTQELVYQQDRRGGYLEISKI